MRIILIPSADEIVKEIPKKAGVSVTWNENEINVTGLSLAEETALTELVNSKIGVQK